MDFSPCQSLDELEAVLKEYVEWFNCQWVSLKIKGMSPTEYQEHTSAV
ncbi:IS3 family transposase [Lactiplantibacillus plajomi]|uniref:IS3 family transposase n=1 Tax=Lactiplantibacillus plajomi TaxID=1457217 RepID=A0ABV6K2W0_9LACO|nr:IS3 family transposase [Lactiplantibacillus plajomi]